MDAILPSSLHRWNRAALATRRAMLRTPRRLRSREVDSRYQSCRSSAELHFRELFEGQTPSSLDLMMARYEQARQNEATPPIRSGKAESIESLKDLAARMLKAFQGSELIKPLAQEFGEKLSRREANMLA